MSAPPSGRPTPSPPRSMIWRAIDDHSSRLRKSRFIRDAAKLIGGTGGAQAIGLIASPLLTRLFTPADFGIFTVMVATLAIVGVWGTLRLDMMIPPASPRTAYAYMRLIGISTIGLVVISSAALLAARRPIAAMIDIPSGSSSVLWMLPILLLANGAFTGVRALAVRNGQFGRIGGSAIIRVLSMTCFWLAVGVAISLRGRIFVMPLGHAFGLLAAAIYLMAGLGRRGVRLIFALRLSAIGRAIQGQKRMIIAVAVGQTFSVLSQRFPVLVIAAAYGPISAGYYALAERIVVAPTLLVANALGDIYRQRASALFRQGRAFAPLLIKMVAWTFPLSLLAFGALAAVVLPFTGDIFGSQWWPAQTTIGLMIIAASFSFATTPFDCTPVIVGAPTYIFLGQLARFIVMGFSCLTAVLISMSYTKFIIVIVGVNVLVFIVDIVSVNIIAIRHKSRLDRIARYHNIQKL